jgi:hypothetical protein
MKRIGARGETATATATGRAEELSDRAYKATQHLDHSNREQARPGALLGGCELAHRDDVDDRGGLRRAAPGHFIESSLVRSGPAPRALGDVEHDAQARPLELVSKSSVFSTWQEAACCRVQQQRKLVNLEPLVLQRRLAAVKSSTLRSSCDFSHIMSSTRTARQLRPNSGRGRGRCPREPISSHRPTE